MTPTKASTPILMALLFGACTTTDPIDARVAPESAVEPATPVISTAPIEASSSNRQRESEAPEAVVTLNAVEQTDRSTFLFEQAWDVFPTANGWDDARVLARQSFDVLGPETRESITPERVELLRTLSGLSLIHI